MKTFPIKIIDTFRDAYSRSQSSLISFRGGEENSDGILYRFQGEDQNRLLKIMFLVAEDPHKALLHFESRLKFVAFLHQNRVSVTEVLPSSNGNLYEKLEDEKGTWVAYVMKRIPGKTMSPKVWDPVFIQNWGKLIGKLHRVTQDYPEWEYCVDPTISEKYLTWESEWENFHKMCKEPAVKVAWEKIGENLRSLPIQRSSFGFIHNDPHIWNILTDSEKLTLINFDVANHHWFINDIAIACQHVLSMLSGGLTQPVHHRDRLVDFLSEFLKGYEHENDLPKEWLTHLDMFFAYRRILLCIVMEDWRRSKPGLQRSWKEMIIRHPDILITNDVENQSITNLLFTPNLN